MKYKIGQILTSNCDVEVEKMFGEKVIIPKGNKIIIGADKFAHHLRNEMIQPLQKEAEVEGYDASGIAEYIFHHLSNYTPIDEMLDCAEFSEEQFKSEIEYALDEIGF